uniref:Granulocyte colony-stimulating factor n=1 Tax=Sarcophilus harrisii TaxID=9305 RepID=A0A7N4NG41_SARHA
VSLDNPPPSHSPALLFWLSAFWPQLQAIPLDSSNHLPPSFFPQIQEQVRKIQNDIEGLQQRLVACLNQLYYGLQFYQGLVRALEGISPELAPTLDTLKLDIGDFAASIWQQMEDFQVVPEIVPTQSILPTFSSSFYRRAGGVLIFSQLQSFLDMAYRALRLLSQS